MGQHFLYSTNAVLKLMIQAEYAGDVHYVWCSEDFDAKHAPAYSLKSLVGPTSNPAEIYRELLRDCKGPDRHSYRINQQKLSFTARAHEWERDCKITAAQRDEILCLVDKAGSDLWKPLLYVIPRAHIKDVRIESVPMPERASFGPEYIIKDLKRSEFELVEFNL